MKKIVLVLTLVLMVFSVALNAKSYGTPSGAKASDFQTKYDPTTPAIRGTFFDDFEGHEDFALDFPPWLQLDFDLCAGTYTSEDCDSFPNDNYMGSYILFNPSETTNGSAVVNDPRYEAYSGYKYAACFAGIPSNFPPGVPQNNDDWLITPLLEFGNDPVLSFYAKTCKPGSWGLEQFQVKVSVNSYDDPDDYEDVGQDYYTAGEDYIEAPAGDPNGWTYYEIDISDYSDEEGFVAIRCISPDLFILAIDDFQVTDVATGIEENSLATDYFMLSNYPNPFNPTTEISFSIKNSENVKLSVFNTKGELISTVIESYLNAGDHSVKFDASELNAGVYYYTIETATASVSNKMVLVK